MGSSEVTPQVCRLPLLAFSQYSRPCSGQSPDADVGTDSSSANTSWFFQGSRPRHPTKLKCSAIPNLNQLLALKALHRPRFVNCKRELQWDKGDWSTSKFVLPPCHRGSRQILMSFPFDHRAQAHFNPAGLVLGPAHSTLNTIASKPLISSEEKSSTSLVATSTKICTIGHSRHLHRYPSTQPTRHATHWCIILTPMMGYRQRV